MNLSINQKGIFYIYATIVFVMMCVSNRTMYTNHIPDTFVMFLGGIQLFFMIVVISSKQSFQFPQILMFIFIGILYVLITIKHPDNSIYRVFIYIGVFSSLASVLLLSDTDKKAMLVFFSKLLFVILSISLTGWIFHLLGFTIPVYENVDLRNDVHNLSNHYIYYDNVYFMDAIFPRFRGIFIEPGQLATPCAFLFFARGAAIKDKTNILLLLAILFSFSLAGYVIVIIGLFLRYLLVQGKFKTAKILGFVLLIGGTAFYFVNNANKDNPLTTLIIERLEYDEELGISGNNRSDEIFDYNYDHYVKSDKIILGIGDEIKVGYNSWTNHASGIKKYFVNYGILGIIVMILLTHLMLKYYYCRSALVFFIVIWLAFLVRDMLQTPFWLTLVILGFYNLKRIDSQK